MKKCALVIGHKKSSPGAINSTSGVSEFVYNDSLSIDIENEVSSVSSGVQIQRIYRRTLKMLPNDINEYSPDFIISLHCNAFDGLVSGTEVLYYHRSSMAKNIAKILNKHLTEALGLKNRGLKPKNSENRGGYLLKYTIAPCIIAEPFFIDNDEDFKIATEKRELLIKAYANGIKAVANFI